jgi:hypothetical protein
MARRRRRRRNPDPDKLTPDFWKGVLAGGVLFVAASYVLHCDFNMGPWPCQQADCRHKGSGAR